ncbi:MAG: hypothetical protein DDT40_01655 [candidate division WS2 bacterium]|uniref:Uncharacterized protein n=1 Tax=Psychracetigena formicireducens TaxID=2986056 RepID=A0A9E2F4C0_PSYF1|nr:hypothetical protein [Candidatus Psychracetigena formicireducens]MBT9144851.1 hypothetical protein [Candidatus Psychracetigena formicireducens]MBT9151460.1 hypothetical protein [Candidatus Psychracetigena formicireducens]
MSVTNISQRNKTALSLPLRKRKSKMKKLANTSYQIHRLIIPFAIALVFFISIQFLVAQNTGIAYQSARLKDQLSSIIRVKRNFEMNYRDVTNPVSLRMLAEKKGFIIPERVYTIQEYLELPHLVTNNEP